MFHDKKIFQVTPREFCSEHEPEVQQFGRQPSPETEPHENTERHHAQSDRRDRPQSQHHHAGSPGRQGRRTFLQRGDDEREHLAAVQVHRLPETDRDSELGCSILRKYVQVLRVVELLSEPVLAIV